MGSSSLTKIDGPDVIQWLLSSRICRYKIVEYVNDVERVSMCAVDAGSTCWPEGGIVVEPEGIGRR